MKTARCVHGEWVAPSEMVYQLGSCNHAHKVSGPTASSRHGPYCGRSYTLQ
jgi:hypothetical protein